MGSEACHADFSARYLAAILGCLFVSSAQGTIVTSGGAHRMPSPQSLVKPADVTVTYTYDANGNRASETGRTLPPSSSTGVTIGYGVNLLGTGGADTVYRGSAGQVGAVETSSTGAVAASVWLTQITGAPAIVDDATTAISTGFNLMSYGGNDVFFRFANGTVGLWEVNSQGVLYNGGENLVTTGGSAIVYSAPRWSVSAAISWDWAAGISSRPMRMEPSGSMKLAPRASFSARRTSI